MKNILIFLLIIFIGNKINAQGCSDAGACTIPVLRPGETVLTVDHKNKISAGITAGVGDYDIFVLTPGISYARSLGSKMIVNTRATCALHSGNDISDFGPGDVFLSLQYPASSKFSFTGGVKIPLTKADRRSDEFGVMLPMDYQSSLGTFDFIGGAGYQNEKWQLALGVQIPLSQNENVFLTPVLDYPNSILNSFPSYPNFERKPDLLLRLLRKIRLSEKMNLLAGFLPIYHVGKDEYSWQDNQHIIDGSDGLTLNATAQMNVKAGENGLFNFSIGFPFIVRDVRPDGLTRSFVAGVEYGVYF